MFLQRGASHLTAIQGGLLASEKMGHGHRVGSQQCRPPREGPGRLLGLAVTLPWSRGRWPWRAGDRGWGHSVMVLQCPSTGGAGLCRRDLAQGRSPGLFCFSPEQPLPPGVPWPSGPAAGTTGSDLGACQPLAGRVASMLCCPRWSAAAPPWLWGECTGSLRSLSRDRCDSASVQAPSIALRLRFGALLVSGKT